MQIRQAQERAVLQAATGQVDVSFLDAELGEEGRREFVNADRLAGGSGLHRPRHVAQFAQQPAASAGSTA